MTLDPYNTLCHHCQKVKANCLFTPGELMQSAATCRKCQAARVKKYQVKGDPARDWRNVGFIAPKRIYSSLFPRGYRRRNKDGKN